MTKARVFADIAGAVSNGKIASDDVNVSFENISDTGTEGTKVATGTTAQRGSTTGQYRYNTTTGFFEGYNGTSFVALAPTPTISSVSPTEIESQAGGNVDIVIQGTNFDSGTTVTFVANDNTTFNATSVAFNSSIQLTATVAKSSFQNSKEPYDVRVTANSGLSATQEDAISVDNSPTWSTASGSLGGGFETESYSFTVSATDAEGDTVAYSLQSGALPSGVSLNTSTGAITGTLPTVSSVTTNTFTIRATTNSGQTADRQFSIINGGSGSTQIYTSSGNFTISQDQPVKAYVIGGGGCGGGEGGKGTLASNEEYGGGGGGGMAYKLFTNLTAGTYSFTVGAGGTGGSRDASPTAGGTSSLTAGGITLQATGGGAGGTDNVTGGGYTVYGSGTGRGSFGGAGGVGSGGDVNGTGGKGGAGADDYSLTRTYTTTSAYEAGEDTSAGKNGINGGAGGGGAGSEQGNDVGTGSNVTIGG